MVRELKLNNCALPLHQLLNGYPLLANKLRQLSLEKVSSPSDDRKWRLTLSRNASNLGGRYARGIIPSTLSITVAISR
jgi:hypothetical protein